jgi:hypothetical protein
MMNWEGYEIKGSWPVSMYWTDLHELRQQNLGAPEYEAGVVTFHSDAGSICDQYREMTLALRLTHGGARPPDYAFTLYTD